VAEELIRFGEVREGWLGLSVADQRVKSDRVDEPRVRVVVASVEPGSPAQAAGVRKGDGIDAVGEQPVESAAEYRFRVRDVPLGGTARLQLSRNGSRLAVAVRPVELSAERIEAQVIQRVGLEAAEERGRSGAVLVVRSVRGGSPAAQVGIQPGDWIRQVNSREVSTVTDWKRAMLQARKAGRLEILVQRGYMYRRVAFDVD
jgi:S1-C subfamily serine protease